MTGSNKPIPRLRKALLFRLEEPLASALQQTLTLCGCKSRLIDAPAAHQRADIVFCPSTGDLLRAALERFRGLPVVVVSRLPEESGWLDALEAGAADYCAAPFEPIHLRWLLDAHIRPHSASAAA
ncbi:MAG: hypothetical protein HY821_23635 [Acidobacteria bacterium]|nr:hypothetical protein [Acidobacteriota bacterium]